MPFYHESEEEEDFPGPPPTRPTQPETEPREPERPITDPTPPEEKIPQDGSQSTDNMADDDLTAGEPDPQYYKLPSKLDDLEGRPVALKKWSAIIDDVIEKLQVKKKAAGKTAHFFNAAREPDTPTETLSIKWIAFPKNLETKPNKWALADERMNQDEYCEWEVERDGKGELKSVTFTTELPEVRILTPAF